MKVYIILRYFHDQMLSTTLLSLQKIPFALSSAVCSDFFTQRCSRLHLASSQAPPSFHLA